MTKIVARIQVGESVQDGIGAVCIRESGAGFEVFINGGVLPNGEDYEYCDNLKQAFGYASEIAELMIESEF